MEAELVGADSPAWRETLSSIRHDAFALPEYATFAARHQHAGDAAALIVREGGARLLMPLILRALPDDLGAPASLRDAISPRGYAGPIAGPAVEAAPDFVARAVAALPGSLRDAGIVTAFLRLNPLSSIPIDVLASVGDVVEHGTSVSIDLSLPTEVLWQQTRHNHRRDIGQARRNGYAARVDDEWRAFDGFVTAYAESMERLGSASFWHFSRAYLEDYRASLGAQLHLCVVEHEGEVAAACMLTEVDGIVDYQYAGTRDEHVAASPSKLMIHFARSWAKERGNERFHLGGSVGPGDALNHFKLGFSPVEHVVATCRITADQDAAAALADAWRESGRLADTDDDSFPPYRRGAIAA